MSKTRGLELALVSAACFSASGSLARAITDAGWSPAAAVAIRCLVAAALLAVPALLELRGRWSVLRGNARLLVAYGALTVAGCQICYFNAVQHMPVGLALLLEYLGIVLVVLWLWLHGQRPRRLMLVGSITALVGVVLVIDPSSGSRIDPIGVLWALGAAIGMAAYFLLSSSSGNTVPPATLACGGMIVGTATVAVCGAVGLAPLHAGAGAVELAGHSVGLWVPALALGLVATAIPYLAGIHAVRRLGPRLASFIALTEVVFAVLLAWLLLGELPVAMQIVGGAIIVIGVALVRLDELAPAASSQAASPAA